MTLILKNVYVDKLGDVVITYNNSYHGTIKIMPVDVNLSKPKRIKTNLELKK